MEKFLRESCVFFEVCVVRSFRLTFVLLFSLFQVAHCWVAYLKRVLFTLLYNFFECFKIPVKWLLQCQILKTRNHILNLYR